MRSESDEVAVSRTEVRLKIGAVRLVRLVRPPSPRPPAQIKGINSRTLKYLKDTHLGSKGRGLTRRVRG